MVRAGAVVALLAGALALACAPAATWLPPLGEALVVADTDAPVPRLVSRLRVDLYTADASTWYASSDLARLDPRDWPVSFGVALSDGEGARDVLVRLRAYADGQLREYHGERFVSRSPSGHPGAPAVPPAPPGEQPRLLDAQGNDVTPAYEPEPFVTIDRLLLVHLAPGVVGKATVVLRGACFGTMADLGNLQTCVDTDATLVDVSSVTLDPDTSLPPPVDKTFGAPVPCPPGASPRPGTTLPDGTRLYDEEVCVPGGTFLFGNPDEFGEGSQSGLPLHVASLSPFTIDRYEVTVARWRDAVARGLRSPDATPTPNPDAIVRDTALDVPPDDARWCTWSAQAGVPEDRERFALNCVSWAAARAFCRFEGGDLPTEAQWEYVAQVYGRDAKTRYPWGDSVPFCGPPYDVAVYARTSNCSSGGVQGRESCETIYPINGCQPLEEACATPGQGPTSCAGFNPHEGPQPVDAVLTQMLPPATDAGAPPLDVSLGLGVVGLAGGVSEWTRDAFDALDANCWAAAPQLDPACVDAKATLHTVKGGSWETYDVALWASRRRPNDTELASGASYDFLPPEVGFRCVRPVAAR
jgi:formylglycine-generating enzyme required for sulfatase activity